MSKAVIAFIIISVIGLLTAGTFFMRRSVDKAFKRVEESIKRSAENVDNANKKLLDSLNVKLKK